MKQLFNKTGIFKCLCIVIAMLSVGLPSKATVHTVTVADFSFSPANFTVRLGDTVMWVWASGTHTTTSTTIPATAAPWDQTLSTSGASFMYKPTVLGTYNYKCTFHVSMGMVGSFVVVSPTNVQNVSGAISCNIFPNPASGALNIQLADAATPMQLQMSDMTGRIVLEKGFSSAQSAIDLQNIPNGLYFVHIVQGQMVLNRKLTIAH